ncbi:MAG: TraB/GumN family protein [Pseudomonadota bacterium]
MTRYKYLALAIGLGFLAACSPSGEGGQSVDDGAVASNTIPAASAVAGPALWRVADEDTTVFLFGTVHVMRPETEWLKDEIVTIIKDADAIYLEADVEGAAAQNAVVEAVTRLGLYTDGSTLSDRLDASEEEELDDALEVLGVPPSGFDNLQPWFAAIQLSDVHLQNQGFSRNAGVERVLGDAASAAGVPKRFLETGAEQIELLASISEDGQIAMLVETARQIEEEPDLLDVMITEWLEGDVQSLGALIAEDETFVSAETTAIMLTDRNRNWARQIDELLEQEAGEYFVAVGAAHLVGEDSLQDQLKGFGHIADRL